jgi:PTH1 family peptidyl-tRNA hydrolase
MKLIVGLGNPGDIYETSRHNIGFLVVDRLSKDCKSFFKRDRGTFSYTCRCHLNKTEVILAKPVTFMNLSGTAVKELLKKYKVSPVDLLVVCDDLDLELGRIKIRPGGSSGGHRGIASIIENIKHQDFARLRIGIGRPRPAQEASDYVLGRFTKKESCAVSEAIEKAAACCESWVAKSIQETMNVFNKRDKKE